MDYTQLGRTGTSVSRIVLGTMNFGDRTPEEEAFAIMDRAVELGVNFFDTANGYGGAGGRGATEEIIGRWFAARPGARDDIVLATKVHSPMVDPTPEGDVVNARGASAWQVRREAIGSLRRLRTDRIDLYQFHHIDRHISWPELWQAMEVLVARGKVVYTGSSNFAAWNIAQANEIAQQRHFLGLVSEQSLYNLVQRSIELEVIPAARSYGLGILPWSPLAGGLLSGGSSDPKARSASLGSARESAASSSTRTRVRARTGVDALGARARVAAPPARRDRPDHRSRARSSSWSRRSPRWTSGWARTICGRSTSSSPAPEDRPPRPTPGSRPPAGLRWLLPRCSARARPCSRAP